MRVAYASVTIAENGRATRSFQAAALVRARFPGKNAPLVNLMFVDKEKKPLGRSQQVAEASVDSCGGYETHRVSLRESDFPRDVLDRASAFLLQLPGTASPVRCTVSPPPF